MKKCLEKCYMVVEVKYDPEVSDADSIADSLDILMDNAKSTSGILDKHGDPRISGFYPVDPEDIQHLKAVAKGSITRAQKDALANILHRLGVLRVPEL